MTIPDGGNDQAPTAFGHFEQRSGTKPTTSPMISVLPSVRSLSRSLQHPEDRSEFPGSSVHHIAPQPEVRQLAHETDDLGVQPMIAVRHGDDLGSPAPMITEPIPTKEDSSLRTDSRIAFDSKRTERAVLPGSAVKGSEIIGTFGGFDGPRAQKSPIALQFGSILVEQAAQQANSRRKGRA